MYLLPQNSAPVNNRKFNLGRMGGRMGCGCSARGIATPPTKRMGGLAGLGDATVGLPSGSQLTYSATFSIPTFSWSATSVATALQAVTNALASYAIRVNGSTNSQSGTKVQVAMTVTTQSDRNAATDVQSVIDGLLQQQGAQSLSSQIGVINMATTNPTTAVYVDPTTGLAVPAPLSSGFDLGSFLSSYGLPIGLGLGALFLVKEL